MTPRAPGSFPPQGGGCDLAVLVHEFPKLSETFVLSDLLALEERGVRLHVFSLRRPEAQLVHAGVGDLRAPVEYLPEIRGRQLGLLVRATQASLVVRNPRRALAGLAEVYASPDYTRLRLQQALLLARRLDRLRAPSLYVHFAHKPATVGRFAALLLDIPFAISAHAVDIWTTPAKELRAKLRDAEVVLCCYREARDHLARMANGSTPITLAPHGVDIPPDSEREEATPPILLATGRLIEKKGFDTLIRAAALIRDRGVEFRVAIVGDGPLWGALQRLVNQHDLGEHVRFMGPLTSEELESHFASAAAFVLPCRVGQDGNRDGLPNTILEAMARGLPVVSTTMASVEEAVSDGEQGFLVAPGDEVELARALERVLGDRELRRQLGAAARLRVAREHDRRALSPLVFEALSAAGLVEGRAG